MLLSLFFLIVIKFVGELVLRNVAVFVIVRPCVVATLLPGKLNEVLVELPVATPIGLLFLNLLRPWDDNDGDGNGVNEGAGLITYRADGGVVCLGEFLIDTLPEWVGLSREDKWD